KSSKVIRATLNLGGNVKTTQKLTWLADSGEDLVPLTLVNLGPLITVPKMTEGDKLKDVTNPNSWKETKAFGDPNLRNLKKGEIIQLQRKGFAIVEKMIKDESKDRLVLIMIPDSKKKAMVNKK
ncbi:hypothetical protein MHBO_002016, partial [Bonamia ostreae]